MGWILTKLWLTGQISGKIIMSMFGGKKKKKYFLHFVKAAFEIPGYNMVNSWKDSSDQKY